MKNLGVTVVDMPNHNTVTIDVPTGEQMKRLHDLGHLYGAPVRRGIAVSADTNPAATAFRDLIAWPRQRSIVMRFGLSGFNRSASGTGRMSLYATGGYSGPGGKSQEDIAARAGGWARIHQSPFEGRRAAPVIGQSHPTTCMSELDRSRPAWIGHLGSGGWWRGVRDPLP